MIRTRIAPSPTGEYHIGHLRTCLYDYALARKNQGQFVLRIEDTDQKRYVPGSENRIMAVIKSYGLNWDEGPDIGGPFAPYVQTKRLATYKKYTQELLDKGHAYYCFCSEDRLKEMRDLQKAAKKVPKYDRHCLSLTPEEIKIKLQNGEQPVVRMHVPDNEIISFSDAVRGEIKINSRDIDDQILVKSNGIPTYQFAVVIDDHLMNITHIFRGEEWISSTPKQIILYRFFGWEIPIIAHLTVLMDPDGHGKMSKRHGSVSAQSFLDEGYLPEAMLNFLMLLGWNPGTDRELFTLDEFVQEFSLDRLHKKSPAFDRKKLNYFNGLYIRQKSHTDLFPYFKKFLPQASDDQIAALVPVLKDRLVKFGDLPIQTKFLFEDVDYPVDLLFQRGADRQLVFDLLTKTKDLFSNLKVFDFESLQTNLMDLIKANSWNTGQFFMVLRVAICGATQTPPLVECLPILGKENTLHKIDLALAKLK
jgi:glutamyl-tRNA synthetase